MNPLRDLFRATRHLAAPAAGILLYTLLAGAERLFSASPAASALVEEGTKALLLLGCGYLCMRRRAPAAAPVTVTGPEIGDLASLRARASHLGAARGLSLGLVAAAAFAGAESLAYLAAFRDAAVLGRITWSLPVHLDAALVEALASLPLLRAVAETRGRGRLLARGIFTRGIFARGILARGLAAPAAIWIGGLAAASLWHLLANSLAAGNPSPTLVAAGSALGIALFAALSSLFASKAYIGGFLNGQR